jgi:hypothetical protein
MADFKDQIKQIANKTKVRVYKPTDNPDDRVSLAGAPVQRDKQGKQFFDIPAHQAEYQSKLHPHYTFGDAFIDEPAKPGRPAKEVE